MIIYEGKEPFKNEVSGNSDPFMFALGVVFLIIMLVFWSGAFIYKRIVS